MGRSPVPIRVCRRTWPIVLPIAGLPTPLKQIAEYNPLSEVAGAMRELFGNPSQPVPDAWPLVHPVAATVLWSVAIVAVVAPLAVRRYRRLASA
jgi:ABC-2 type transport system permease protein